MNFKIRLKMYSVFISLDKNTNFIKHPFITVKCIRLWYKRKIYIKNSHYRIHWLVTVTMRYISIRLVWLIVCVVIQIVENGTCLPFDIVLLCLYVCKTLTTQIKKNKTSSRLYIMNNNFKSLVSGQTCKTSTTLVSFSYRKPERNSSTNTFNKSETNIILQDRIIITMSNTRLYSNKKTSTN